jgi:ferrous iron transport protein B
MMDWLFKKIGLNGKAVLPIVLGFGCDTMATLTTRILETRRERIIATLLLALAIPCSAQLGIISGVLADIGGGGAFALYVGVIASQFLFIGWLASKAIKGRNSDFMLEIPPFRVPQLANIVVKTVHRVIWFVKEAVPLFLIGTLALFILTRIGYNEVSRPLGLLSYADRIGAPVTVRLLGLPAQPAEPQSAAAAQPGVGSRVRHSSTQAFILGFLRRDYGAVSIRENFKGRFFSARQAMVTLIVITLFVPCLANLLVIIKERGPATAALIVGFIIPYAFLVGAALNYVLAATGAM